MTKEELIFVSSPKSDAILGVWNVRDFNNLPNVHKLVEDYDVGSLQDYYDDAVLIEDFEFYNSCIEYLMGECIVKEIDGNYIVQGLVNDERIECKTYDEALFVYSSKLMKI
jgi:hypothetical protein